MSDIFHAIEISKQKIRAMECESQTVEKPIMAIVHSKFDAITKGIRQFQLSLMEPTFQLMERFLEQRSNMIQEELGPQQQPAPIPETPGARRKSTACIYCKSAMHTIYKCASGFEALTIAAKKQCLRREERCENCFMKSPADICTGAPVGLVRSSMIPCCARKIRKMCK